MGVKELENRVTRWSRTEPRSLDQAARRRFFLTGALVVLATSALSLTVYFVAMPHHNQFDLKIYHSAVQFWLDGGNIYDYAQPDPVNISLGFTYPPFSAVLMAPMSWLPVGFVQVVHLIGVLVAGFVVSLLTVRERLTLPRFQEWVVAGAVTGLGFGFLPWALNISFGQVNLFLAVLILLDLLVLDRRGSRWAGVGIGLAMAIKLTPGIFLLYLVLAKRWTACLVAVGTAAVVTLLTAAIAPSESWRYFTQLLWDDDRVGFVDTPTNQSVNGFLIRLFAPETPSKIWWAGACVLLVAGVGWRVLRALKAGDKLAAVSLTGLLGIVVSPVSWVHHIVWILPAAVVAVAWLWRTRADSSRSTGVLVQWWAVLVLMVVGVWLWFVDTRMWFDLPHTGYGSIGLLGVLESSLPTFWILIMLFLLPIARPARSAPADAR